MEAAREIERGFYLIVMVSAAVCIVAIVGGWLHYWRERRRVRRIFAERAR